VETTRSTKSFATDDVADAGVMLEDRSLKILKDLIPEYF
jgi:hypothetical protein